jgi:transposase
MHATKLAIRTLGRRVLDLEADAHDLDRLIHALVRRAAPTLLDVHGVGTHTAAILLVAAGDNPHRLKSEAAFAHLCDVARPCPRRRARSSVTGSTRAGTVKRTMPCGGSCSRA